MMNRFTGFQSRICRNAEGGASGGASAPAGGAAPAAAPGAPATMADAAASSQQDNSVSVSVPTGGSPKPADGWRKDLGDLGNNPALKDFKDIASLGKAYVDTKAALGMPKVGIPGPDAKPEVVAEFWKQMGVPDKAEDYGFGQAPADLPEGLEFNQEEASNFAKFAHENKIPKELAATLQKWDIERQVGQINKAGEAAKARETQLDGLLEQRYGKDKEAAYNTARGLLDKFAPAEDKEFLKSLDNKTLAAVTTVLNNIHKEVFTEDSANNNRNFGGDSGKGATVDSLTQELRTLQASDAYNSPFKEGKEAHESAKAKARSLSTQIASLQKVKK